jgi:branched-chain amino acid aminotransferase
MSELFFVYNDKVYASNTPIISAGNRSLRYGDGLFETMKMLKGRIVNEAFHFERLFAGLSMLQFDVPKHFNRALLRGKIHDLAGKNNHAGSARVRLMLFRGNGGIFDPENLRPNYIIETWSLPNEMALNENGLVVDVFPDAQKSVDKFSNLKSNNYLPYVMAGLFAKENKWNDCIVLNSYGRICDSAIANVFIVEQNKIVTPPLSEGCVAGVMRRWMLEKLNPEKYTIVERKLSVSDLLNADEMFLTNSIYQLRWVGSFRGKKFDNKISQEIYSHILQTI